MRDTMHINKFIDMEGVLLEKSNSLFYNTKDKNPGNWPCNRSAGDYVVAWRQTMHTFFWNCIKINDILAKC